MAHCSHELAVHSSSPCWHSSSVPLNFELPKGTSVTFMMEPTDATASLRLVETKAAHPAHRASVQARTETGRAASGEKARALARNMRCCDAHGGPECRHGR